MSLVYEQGAGEGPVGRRTLPRRGHRTDCPGSDIDEVPGGRPCDRRAGARAAPRKLQALVGVRKLLLEGGGGINGSSLASDLIDGPSVLLAPIADGSSGAPPLFDAKQGRGPARPLKLVGFEKRAGDLLWLRC